MNFKNFSDLSCDIQKNIHKICDEKFDLVVGLPRSGMIPAYMISLRLNVHCTDISSFIENRPLKSGYMRRTKSEIKRPQDAIKILVVDDTILSGKSLSSDLMLVPKSLRKKIYTLAIYSSERYRNDVDMFFEHLPAPRVFEWNIFHHPILSNSCVDIDGVLCVDPTEEENDDGPKYREFLLNAKPLFLPSQQIHSLVTSRLEKYREETETWLNKNKISYKNLIMLNLQTKEERVNQRIHGRFKANSYKNPEAKLFIESNPEQSMEICALTGKPVYCPSNAIMYQPDMLSRVKYAPSGVLKKSLNFVRKKLKEGGEAV